jgi:hypothetical protein
MKNRTILLFLLLLAANEIFCQLKPFRFGFKVAPDLSWISPDSKEYENDGLTAGFSWGFIADITMANNYFFKTGFNYDYLNGKLQFPYLKQETDSSIVGTMSRKYKLRYLEVPMTIKLKTNKFGKMAWFGEVGVGTAFKLRAKSKDEFHDVANHESTQWESDVSNEVPFIKESLLAGVGTEFYFDESTSLMLELSFSNSLTDILNGDNTRFSDISQNGFLYYFQLNVGIIF